MIICQKLGSISYNIQIDEIKVIQKLPTRHSEVELIMKLISMVDFVLEQNKILETYVNHLRRPLFERCVNYANFLKQPLKLEMFIGEDAIFIFQWEFTEWNDLDMENQKIEDLLNDDLIYVLNDNAIKQIGL